ncbi:DUF1146 family protein [Facklamia languida]|uniref:DUF1146 domain-containing protein n=1 Tax=Facklamia languida CCUG 37842 TaxID=883113 RepID=H3NH32_9LACT|nr:DUF1146 family protein [Facklamia languida]EHR38087.1 hypothetical protein HMPREF9708_00171 [Facklamia languida CCUG 37842]
MSAIINGMAVLLIRILFVVIAYFALSKVKWKQILYPNYHAMDRYLCLLVSLALGYLTSSFFITIIESLQQILLSIFSNHV